MTSRIKQIFTGTALENKRQSTEKCKYPDGMSSGAPGIAWTPDCYELSDGDAG